MRTNITNNKIREFNHIVAELSFKPFPENIKAALITRLRKLSYYIEQNSLKKEIYKNAEIISKGKEQVTSLEMRMQVMVKKLFRILLLNDN